MDEGEPPAAVWLCRRNVLHVWHAQYRRFIVEMDGKTQLLWPGVPPPSLSPPILREAALCRFRQKYGA
jgi:hypothetical protein